MMFGPRSADELEDDDEVEEEEAAVEGTKYVPVDTTTTAASPVMLPRRLLPSHRGSGSGTRRSDLTSPDQEKYVPIKSSHSAFHSSSGSSGESTIL